MKFYNVKAIPVRTECQWLHVTGLDDVWRKLAYTKGWNKLFTRVSGTRFRDWKLNEYIKPNSLSVQDKRIKGKSGSGRSMSTDSSNINHLAEDLWLSPGRDGCSHKTEHTISVYHDYNVYILHLINIYLASDSNIWADMWYSAVLK